MAVKLRLMRMGKTKQPTYRVVASDSRSPRNGRFIELLGTYEPRLEPSGIKIDADKANKWLSNCAQPTERVQKLLVNVGILDAEAAAKTQAGIKATRRPNKPSKADAAAAAAAPAAGDSAAQDMKEAEEASAAGDNTGNPAPAEEVAVGDAAEDMKEAEEAAAQGEK